MSSTCIPSESSSQHSSSSEEHKGSGAGPKSQQSYFRPPEAEYPRTYAPWLDGLRGNVRFEEWHDFEALVTNTSDAIESIDTTEDESLNDALKELRTETKNHIDFLLSKVKRRFSIRWQHSGIFFYIHDLLCHFERSKGYWFLEQNFYLENPVRLWRDMCLRPKTEGNLAKLRPPLKQSIPDMTLVMKKSPLNMFDVPICGFALKAPTSNIILDSNSNSPSHPDDSQDVTGELEKEPAHRFDVSAEELCTRYNHLFASISSDTPRGRQLDYWNANGDALDVLAQAMSYCLSVASGCVLLCNKEYGVAFEVVKRPFDGHLHVGVSRAFHREEAIIGILALSQYSIKRVREDEDLPEFIADCAERIAKVTREVQDKIGQQETSGSCEGDIPKLARAGNGYSKKGPQEGSGCSGQEAISMSENGVLNCEVNNEAQCGKTEESKRVISESSDGDMLGIREARRLDRRDIIGNGHSGIVYKAFWNGRTVAVKEWNGIREEGVRLLVHEVTIVETLKRKCPSWFGSLAPNVLLAWKNNGDDHHGANEPLLVTEFVGKDLYREKGRLLTSVTNGHNETVSIRDGEYYKPVSGSEELAICDAAIQALKVLHGRGFLHGSVNIRNIRAEKICRGPEKDDDMAGEWRVWWIDFGRTEKARANSKWRSFLFRSEIRACLDLFHTQGKDDNNDVEEDETDEDSDA